MLCDFVINDHIDILAVTETWLSGDDRDNPSLADLTSTLPNYQWHHIPRKGRQGGGVGVCIKKGFKVRLYP